MFFEQVLRSEDIHSVTSFNVYRGLLIIIPECVSVCAFVCACVISEQLNQENGKSYGTGFFGKVQR